MRLYLAGLNTEIISQEIVDMLRMAEVKYLLLSYYYIKNSPECIHLTKKIVPHLFLDSGAFSAMTLNAKIDIDDYIEFVKEYGNQFDAVAGLDVIGDAEATMKNQLYMEREGLKPIPTFHYGSDFKYLDMLIDAGYDYIALGGFRKQPTKQQFVFLNEAFERIPRKVKVHGFAATKVKLIRRYPWYSVDSTSWLSTRKFGRHRVYRDGKLKSIKIKIPPRKNDGAYRIGDKFSLLQWSKFAKYLEPLGWHMYNKSI